MNAIVNDERKFPQMYVFINAGAILIVVVLPLLVEAEDHVSFMFHYFITGVAVLGLGLIQRILWSCLHRYVTSTLAWAAFLVLPCVVHIAGYQRKFIRWTRYDCNNPIPKVVMNTDTVERVYQIVEKPQSLGTKNTP